MNQNEGWFDEYLEHLKAYKAQYGDCDVPYEYVCADGYPLGEWTEDIRQMKREQDQEAALLN